MVQRSVSRRIYRKRNLVECFFCKLRYFERVATRFDKLARNFLAAVALASARLWTTAYDSTALVEAPFMKIGLPLSVGTWFRTFGPR